MYGLISVELRELPGRASIGPGGPGRIAQNRANARLVSFSKADVLQGTLILLVLRTLDVLGPMHGYGIARRIEQISGELLQLNQGTLYPALLRMEQEKWISSKWGASEKNRKAKFYTITAARRRQLAKTTDDWQRMSTHHRALPH